jgi:hypothetical protein
MTEKYCLSSEVGFEATFVAWFITLPTEAAA